MSGNWADREVARIEALPNTEFIIELYNAMNGHTYSWRTIQKQLQELKIDYNVYQDWNDLLTLKRTWDCNPSLTRLRQHKDIVQGLSRDLSRRSWNPKHLRRLLINLRLILVRAGMAEEEAVALVSKNVDVKGAIEDLWIPVEKEERYFSNGRWDLELGIDEEKPLLGDDDAANEHRAIWGWRKWLSLI
ncbi:hypothetical protein L207DRAFT_622319 [Hyaloscypha variabilis F]|uniref:Uncharacterized protein n=1 Tax=Hyaloscypha variabilis (strain UAMH 11265 / GT02V1 / F) TaxID=1149755 RepID=A0A2J6RUY6_HYAVF|nr:hypothetical protein L207DRAFT_622319 [Hyaloscypha variabilis F]